jgi:hypothetical protein
MLKIVTKNYILEHHKKKIGAQLHNVKIQKIVIKA